MSPGPKAAADGAAAGTQLYRAGKFPEADHAYREALDADPDNLEALAGAGAVALLGNHLEEATARLERVVERSPDNLRVLQDLAEAAYRRDDFQDAAGWLRRLATTVGGVDRQELEVVIRKLEDLKGTTPYRPDFGGDPREVRVPLVATDPLPVVNVTLNDRVTVPFFLDTGGHEVYVDRTLAADLGLVDYGTTSITGPGGKQGTEGHGRLDRMTLGDLRVHDLPVKTLDFTALGFAEALGGIPVKGAITTAFLYHFLPTVDYPGGALVLRPRTPDGLRSFEQRAGREQQHTVPFWLSGTHYILARGTINSSDPMLLLVDTGGAAIAFTGTNSTIQLAGVDLQHDQAQEGPGAGGATQAVPFVVDELTLGEVSARKLPGVFFPEADLEDALRQDGVARREFAVGGIISHQYFRPYALTFDFDGMRLFLGSPV